MEKPSKEQLEKLYLIEKASPEEIGKLFFRSGRQIRTWLKDYGIPRLGPTHLRRGKTAAWNIGRLVSKETRLKMSESRKGTIPHNIFKGSASFRCEVCKKEVFDKPYRRKRTCSVECKNQLSAIHAGENHWNFKGDDAGFRQRQRNWAVYREWRRLVLETAGFTCEKCGRVGGRLTAHHKASWSKHPESRFDVLNGSCLCWEHHWAFHRKYGHRNTTPEMFYE